MARDNYKKQLSITIRNMEEVLMSVLNENAQSESEILLSEGEEEKMPIYVASNRKSIFGATAILFPQEIKSLADAYKSDLIILPCSIHEILLIPDNMGEMGIDEYLRMVSEVNQSQLRADEVLSYSVYRYKWKEEIIECMLEENRNK